MVGQGRAARMKTKAILLASTLAALGLATFARAQDEFRGELDVSGIQYRVAGVNSVLMLRPEDPLPTPKSAPALKLDQKLSRCDEFVALALKLWGRAGSRDARLVRERVEPQRGDRSLVVYSQRHQGYEILGGGGRLEIDSHGRVLFAGLGYETEKLRDFRPMNFAALQKLAASAVPHRMGPPVEHGLKIDPLGDAPAELRAYLIYMVRNRGRLEGWQVVVNAETGKVVHSASTMMNAGSQQGGGRTGS